MNERKLGATLSYISIIINTIIQLAYTPLLIRMLGQSEYGLYSLVASIIGYLTILDLGFGNAIVVYTVKYHSQKLYDQEEKLHGMFKIIFIIIGTIAAILGFLLFLNIENIFGKSLTDFELNKMKVMMIILIFNLTISFIFSIYSSILNAYEKFIYQKIVSILNSILKPIIMIPLLFLGFKSITMTIIVTILNILVLISNYVYCKKKLNLKIKFRGFDMKLFKVILGYSIWIFLGVIVDKINWSVDQFVLGSIVGTTAVSIYSVASTLNNLFINLSTATSGVFLPKISKLVAQNVSSQILTDEMIKVGRIQYYILFLACSGLILFGKQFIIWWVGDKFIESYYVALILIIPVCFPLIQNIGLSIMQAMNKFKFKSITSIIMAIFNLIISIILAKRYGAVGSAIGTAVSLFICNILIVNIYYYKVLKLNVLKFWLSIFKITFTNIFPIILILILMKLIKLTKIVNVLIFGGIYSIIYFMFIYKFSMNQYEKNLINGIILKLKNRKLVKEVNL